MLWPIIDHVWSARAQHFGISDPEVALSDAGDIVLYGAGDFARAVLDSWRDRNLPVRYLVDSNTAKQGSTWQGYFIAGPDRLAADRSRPLIVVAAMDTSALRGVLERLDLPYLFAERNGTVGFLPGHMIVRRRDAFERLFGLLSDEWSRFVLLSVAVARLFQNFQYPMKGNIFTDRCTTHPQYFSVDLPPIREGECYVDCGAFDGDSLVSFVAAALRLGLWHWSAMGIEADPGNAALARVNLAALGLSHIAVRQAVLGTGCEGIGDLHLHNCLGSAIPGDEASVALDDLLYGLRPSFIKMDIEGAELLALSGARRIILSEQPRLAVCTYHTTADLTDIPFYISDNFPFYDLYLRHHRGGSLWETVCYALPRSISGGKRDP